MDSQDTLIGSRSREAPAAGALAEGYRPEWAGRELVSSSPGTSGLERGAEDGPEWSVPYRPLSVAVARSEIGCDVGILATSIGHYKWFV